MYTSNPTIRSGHAWPGSRLPALAATMAILALSLLISAASVSAGPDADAPVVTFSTYYGGSTQECIFDPCAVATDGDGNIWVAGPTRSDDFPLTNPYTTTFASGSGTDIFVVKLEAGTHDVLYSTYLAGGVAQGITVDRDGNAYVVGYSSDEKFPVTANAAQPSYQGGFDAVVAKVSADGSLILYATFLGGSGHDEGYDIAVDDAGTIYVTGATMSDDFIRKNAHQPVHGGDDDVFVTKINADGSLAYSTYLGGSAEDAGWGLAIDDLGNAYIAGRSYSDDFPVTPGVIQEDLFSKAGADAIVAKMTPAGALAYATYFNQTSTDNAVDVAVNAQGNAHIITTHEGVLKFNGDASALLYWTNLNIEVNVHGEGGIAVDSDGVAYASGWRDGPAGGKDIVLAALTPGGRIAYNRTFGGSNDDRGYSVAVYEDGAGHKRAYIAGATTSDDFPTEDPVQASLNGSNDLVVLTVDGMENLPLYAVFLPVARR